MNEQQIQATLKRAAGGAVLPEKFRSVSHLVLAPAPTAPKHPRWGGTLLRAAGVAAVVFIALAGLALTQPGQKVLAEALRQLGWVSVDPRSLEESMGDFRKAKTPPPVPEDLRQAAQIDPAEARRQHGFVAPLPDGESTLVAERASRLIRLDKDRQYRIADGIVTYGQSYRLPTGEEVHVNQQFVVPPQDGPLYQLSPGTRETKILGHPAYVTTRHIGWDDQGRQEISEFPAVTLFMQAADKTRWLEIRLLSTQASLEQVMQLAETFTAHAAVALAVD